MDLAPSQEEEQFVNLAASFLRGSYPHTRLHGADDGRYTSLIQREFAEQGWLSLGLPEELGGIGFTSVDEMLLFREGGRQLVPLGVLIANLAAKAAATNPTTRDRIISGETGIALAVADVNRGRFRLFEHEGAELALAIRGEEAVLVPLGKANIDPAPCLDKSVTMGFADLDAVDPVARAPAQALLVSARLLTAASLVGIAEAVTDMIVDYAKIRETFGRPIGSYQAVRHPIAEMAVRHFTARAQLFFAAVKVRDGDDDHAVHVDAALALARDAASLNCDATIQLHGGIATTDEHDSHHFMKRTHVLNQLFGGKTALDRVLATRMSA